MSSMWLSDTQKIGVVFCSGGMLRFAKIGAGAKPGRLLAPSPTSLTRRHQVILFLIGLTIIIGPQKTLAFFARKQKAKGTAAFFAGLILILLRWTIIGFLVEGYGIVILFGDFLGTIAGFARGIPVVGPYIGVAIDRLGVARSNAELPV
ncbi:Got1 family protein [Cordyceps fumosorosea ARSEF 2679]|uniref:Got1 family protein n=1 Tax=Cordyceps fumosorosea (strain ARSEF 2679) TaxID=1081104 RepID=A0A167U9Z0_CORFA|nr:Got1 family protein [Cordyceps fumosorosea ARSEF 2679]OAA61369.1 Got1 family protein [Cordyceps fumosorosea ARSEF 2679]